MSVIRTTCCAALFAVALAVPNPAGAVMVHHVAASKPAAVPDCSLPTDGNHLPHPMLSARLNPNQTITFQGMTCPALLIGVYVVHGTRVLNLAQDLVCQALADQQGNFSCTSLARYPVSTKFGVAISGQFIIGLQSAAIPRHPGHPRHPRHPRPKGAPNTGLGGMAGSVAGHHLRDAGVARHPRRVLSVGRVRSSHHASHLRHLRHRQR